MPELQPILAPTAGVFAPRVLTGDRPTGQLHLGHLFGTLAESGPAAGRRGRPVRADRRLSDDHRPRQSRVAARRCRGAARRHLAVGIDPARTTIFAHSLVPELNQLMFPFLSLVTLPELLRNPTVKEEAAASACRRSTA